MPCAVRCAHVPISLHVQVRALLAQLAKHWPEAESLLLAQGRVDDCIAMFTDNYRWVLKQINKT